MRESMDRLLLLDIVTLLCRWLKGSYEFKDLLRMADEAMYLVKNTTRNSIALAGEGIRA